MKPHLRIPKIAFFALAVAWPALCQPKTAEQQFKNIQALKGTPADELFPAMQVISASLGVQCDFCHVQGKFDSDDKRTKQTARKMIEMTLALNRDNFSGRREVTCYSCHRGKEEPVGIPPVMNAEPEPPQSGSPIAGVPAAADQILAQYIAAVGGAEALHKISTRIAKGTILTMGHESPIELYMKAPDKRMSIAHMPNGESITAFDGVNGWLGGGGGHPPRDMEGASLEAARLDADFYLPTHLKEIFSGFRVGHSEKIDDHTVDTLIAIRQGQPPVRFYFDRSSGLLVRQVRYADTPVGRNPTQIDYGDYREADGVKLPFRWTLARLEGRFTIQIQELQQNVPIDNAKFSKPAPGGN